MVDAGNKSNVAQYLLRAFAGVFVCAVEYLATSILQVAQPFADYHLIAIMLSLVVLLLVPFLGRQGVICDLQDLCWYDLLVQIYGLFCARSGHDLSFYGTLAIFIYYLKFTRILWAERESNGALVEWPILGFVGYTQRRKRSVQITRAQKLRILGAVLVTLVVSEVHRRYWSEPLVPIFIVALSLTLLYCQPLYAFLEKSEAKLLTTTAELATATEQARVADVLAALASELATKNGQLEEANHAMLLANDELGIANQRLENANLELERHARVVEQANHDISPLLNFIHSFVEQLSQTGLNAQQAETVRKIGAVNLQVGERLEKIIGIQRNEALQNGSIFSAVCLDSVLASCEEPFILLAQSHQMDFAIRGNTQVRVWSNADYLQRIITNLVKNAIIHNPPGTRVRLVVVRRRAGFFIRIYDTGQGVPEATGVSHYANFAALLERIRQRVHMLGSQSGAISHGIGLQSVAALCKELNMNMALYTRCKLGAIFEFYLEHAA